MQKNIFLVPLTAIIFLSTPTWIVLSAQAASPSPVASDSASAQQVTENLKKRLQTSLETQSDNPVSSVRAYIGMIKDVIKDTIIIQDKDGKKDVKLQDDTTILRSPGNTSIKPENIRLGDYIIAIGYPGDDILFARRLIVSADSITPPAKTSGLGTIVELSASSLTLQLGQDQPQPITLTGKTIFKSASSTIESSDLKLGDTVIYTALVGKDDAKQATVILRIKTSATPQ